MLPLLAALFLSPAPARQLITDEAAFQPFAHQVAVEVDRQLATDPHPSLLLLALKVHLSIHGGQDDAALAAAAQIRARQGSAEDRAYAGLVTQAIVTADHSGAARGSPAFIAAFTRTLQSALSGLPRTVAMRAVLQRQRQKTQDAVPAQLAAAAEAHVRRTAAGYSWEDADQIVRAHHEIFDLGPLRSATLAAYDAELAQLPS